MPSKPTSVHGNGDAPLQVRSSIGAQLARIILLSWIVPATHSSIGLASPPDPTQSDLDPVVLGTSSGVPKEMEYVVQLRDINGAPEAGWLVTLRFPPGEPRPYVEQHPGFTVDCTENTVSSVTGSDGRVVFALRLAGYDNAGSVEVRGSGILMGFVPARSTDLDGDGSTDLSDLEHLRLNFFEDPSAPETDWDLDGETGLGDLNLLRAEFFRDASGAVCGG